eukprot:TRINITY_DN7883_c0_g3_i1.p2 TRINITY_DN7883_c0_g3~~TRINITY_DN7883_c0_g3_i1.p2  ORF type:complete len:217 (+),score=21.44 TRINITY_DN7883_c0_g3_i1:1095-1745(+)
MEVTFLVLKFSALSASFAALFDGCSQLIENGHSEEDPAPSYDVQRTGRYALVHALWNGPYHVPKLMIIMAIFPGVGTMVALKRTLVADLVFSPLESLGVLLFTQLLKGSSRHEVGEKLSADFLPYTIVKWAGHVPCHFLAFKTDGSITTVYVTSMIYKSAAEIALAFLTARSVPSKGDQVTPRPAVHKLKTFNHKHDDNTNPDQPLTKDDKNENEG